MGNLGKHFALAPEELYCLVCEAYLQNRHFHLPYLSISLHRA